MKNELYPDKGNDRAVEPFPQQDNWNQDLLRAEFDRLQERVESWVKTAPNWEPFRQAQTLFETIKPRLKKLDMSLDTVLVVGFVGGTGTGKSTLVNALVGERVCPAGRNQRPITVRPQVVCYEGTNVSPLGLDDQIATRHERTLPLLKHLVLIDCPDPDTQPTDDRISENRNRDILRSILPHCDVIVHVSSQEKYKNTAVHEEIVKIAPGCHFIFVQSKASEDSDIREDWKNTLNKAGFQIPEIFRFDAEEILTAKEKVSPINEEFERFTQLLQHLSSHTRHRIKRANALELYDWMFSHMQAILDERQPALKRLATEIERQENLLQFKIESWLVQQLQRNPLTWRSRLINQIWQKWAGGPFASFLRLLGASSSFLRWVPLLRTRSVTQLATVGGVIAASALHDKWNEIKESRDIVNTTELGITKSDVGEARSKLEGYAQESAIDTMLESRKESRREEFLEEILANVTLQLQQRFDYALDVATEQQILERGGPNIHRLFEVLFSLIPMFVAWNLGRNFFYDYPLKGQPPLGLDYLVQAALWIFVAGWLLRELLLWWLNKGLRNDMTKFTEEICRTRLFSSISVDMTNVIETIQKHVQIFSSLCGELRRLKTQLDEVEVGIGKVDVHSRANAPKPENH